MKSRGEPSRCARCKYVTDSVRELKQAYVEVTCLVCSGLKARELLHKESAE